MAAGRKPTIDEIMDFNGPTIQMSVPDGAARVKPYVPTNTAATSNSPTSSVASGTVNTTVPAYPAVASKAGAHRTRNTGFTSQPKINDSAISSPGVRPTSLLKEYNKDRADSIKAGGKALGYGLANTKWLANSAKAIDRLGGRTSVLWKS